MATQNTERSRTADMVVWRSAKRMIERRGTGALRLAENARNHLLWEGDARGAVTWRKTTLAVQWLLDHPESMKLIETRRW